VQNIHFLVVLKDFEVVEATVVSQVLPAKAYFYRIIFYTSI